VELEKFGLIISTRWLVLEGRFSPAGLRHIARRSCQAGPGIACNPLSAEEVVMVKVLMERTIRGQNVGQIVRLLRQLRVLAMQQPGYISGETCTGWMTQLLPGDQRLGIPDQCRTGSTTRSARN